MTSFSVRREGEMLSAISPLAHQHRDERGRESYAAALARAAACAGTAVAAVAGRAGTHYRGEVEVIT